MEEIKTGEITETNPETETNIKTEDNPEELRKAREDLRKTIQERLEKERAILRDATEVIAAGKGRLKLEMPFTIGERTYEELIYDFMDLKGFEYADAMGTDPQADNAYRITQRQALALFAKAAAKQTEGLDMQDIQGELGITDAVEGVQLATLFFNASTRAGRMRISKK